MGLQGLTRAYMGLSLSLGLSLGLTLLNPGPNLRLKPVLNPGLNLWWDLSLMQPGGRRHTAWPIPQANLEDWSLIGLPVARAWYGHFTAKGSIQCLLKDSENAGALGWTGNSTFVWRVVAPSYGLTKPEA